MSNSTESSTTTNSNIWFNYDPSLAMGWIAGILFTIAAIVHVVQYIRYRALYLYLFLLGVFMEAAGYWTHVVAVKEPKNNGANSMTYLLITLAPSLLAAGCYMTFGRIIYWATPENRRSFRYLWVPARYVTLVFTTLDILSFLIQAIGVFVMIANLNKEDQGKEDRKNALRLTYDILRAGFIMQLIVFGVFMLIAFKFMFSSKNWRFDWPDRGSGEWRKMAWTTVVAAFLITGRSLYRCLQFSLSRGDNYLRTHEWPFYLFDMVPILLVLIAFIAFHPGSRMPPEYNTIRHAYKKPGFKATVAKEVEEEQRTAGYSRVSLVPPPLAPPPNQAAPPMNHIPHSSMNFSDPWNNRPSPGADRY